MNTTVSQAPSGWLERLATTVADIVFPPVCAYCGRLGTVLCDSCLSSLVGVSGVLCGACGRMLPDHDAGVAHLCSACSLNRPLLREARAPLLYVEPTNELIHRLKYDGYFALARPLAALMADAWPKWDSDPDIILPIPLHRRRQRQRGYNQSALLGKHLAHQMGLDYDDKCLRRHRHTQPQVRLSPEERRSNVAGAFEADPVRLVNRSVLLVDDVYTTGATMGAAAEALLSAGARAVSGYCLARVS